MHRLTALGVSIATLLLVFCFTAVAAPALDCVSVHQDFSHLQVAKAQGLYRDSQSADAPVFQFAALPPFSEYLAFSSQLIESRNPHAARPCPISSPVTAIQHSANQHPANQQSSQPVRVSDLIQPFELRQPDQKKAILLIHGLTDSPYLFHDLAGYFYQQGFTVRTLLLPGHGTVPADLIDVTDLQWRQAAQYAIERTVQDFDQVYLGGFSTGGALIFDYLMHKTSVSNKIAGLLMWSPASAPKDSMAFLAGVVDLIPGFDWLDKGADTDFAKYESFAINAGAQVYSLMQRIDVSRRKSLKFHDIPLLVVASAADTTIDTAATLKLTQAWHQAAGRTNAAKDQLIYYGDSATIPATLSATLRSTVPTCTADGPCRAVQDIAHTAVTNSPQNQHYGMNGHYRNCNHYSDDKAYQQCKTAANITVGETTEQNLSKFRPLQRLTYNPYYAEMLVNIGQFIQ